jgi:hypothetical protein
MEIQVVETQQQCNINAIGYITFNSHRLYHVSRCRQAIRLIFHLSQVLKPTSFDRFIDKAPYQHVRLLVWIHFVSFLARFLSRFPQCLDSSNEEYHEVVHLIFKVAR